MKMVRKILVVAAIITLMPLAVHAGQTKAEVKGKSSPITVGDFAVMLANVGQNQPIDMRTAADSLVRTGVPLGDLTAPLSERKLAEILDFYGVRATTGNADQGVSAGKADAALMLVGGALEASAAKSSSPGVSSLDDCLAASNHGRCVNCCKETGMKPNGCARLCFEINKQSASEPLP